MYGFLLNSGFLLYLLAAVLFIPAGITGTGKPRRAAEGLLAAGAAAIFSAILFRWTRSGYPPLTSLHETLVLFSLFLAGAGLLAGAGGRRAALGGAAAFACLVSLGCASLLDARIPPLMPALRSNWLVIHVTSYFLGYSACFVAFLAGAAYLLRRRAGAADRESLRRLDELGYRSTLAAFPLLTLGLTTGAVWAHVAWGRYWGWDPKETGALVTWLVYVLTLHARPLSRDPGRSSAVLSVLGFVSILFTFVGVTLFLGGLHSYR